MMIILDVVPALHAIKKTVPIPIPKEVTHIIIIS